MDLPHNSGTPAFCTSPIALGGAFSPRKLQIVNTKVSCSTAVFDSKSNSPADTPTVKP